MPGTSRFSRSKSSWIPRKKARHVSGSRGMPSSSSRLHCVPGRRASKATGQHRAARSQTSGGGRSRSSSASSSRDRSSALRTKRELEGLSIHGEEQGRRAVVEALERRRHLAAAERPLGAHGIFADEGGRLAVYATAEVDEDELIPQREDIAIDEGALGGRVDDVPPAVAGRTRRAGGRGRGRGRGGGGGSARGGRRARRRHRGQEGRPRPSERLARARARREGEEEGGRPRGHRVAGSTVFTPTMRR